MATQGAARSPTEQQRPQWAHTRGAPGPLLRKAQVTPERLGEFLRLRRSMFGLDGGVADSADRAALGSGGLTETARELAAAQCEALESGAVLTGESECLDTLYRHRLLLVQARKGYRCNVDSLLLAQFAADRQRGATAVGAVRIADLGAGSGVVGISLGLHLPAASLLLLELQPAMADRCARNLRLNDLHRRGAAVCADAASGAPPGERGRCDFVVCNPPYWSAEQQRRRGRPPADP
jgi:hypothetical protein